jgi:EmrB/QacA subfamily drug resistance transporter
MSTTAPVKESPTAGPVTPAMSHPGHPRSNQSHPNQPRSSKRSTRPPRAPSQPPRGVQAASDARRRSLGLALILAASFMVVLDFSIVNVALPSIETEMGLAASAVQWVITGYAITFGGLLILGGRAADLLGRRRMFVAGLLVFTAASLAGGLAHDLTALVVSRAVQGAGAALVAPAALSLITTGFAQGQQRTRALGMYGATASVGFVAGQVLGGVLVQFTSWRAVFLVNVPVGLLAALLAPKLLAKSPRPPVTRGPDVGGAVFITAAVAFLVFAVSQANVLGWVSPAILAALALFVISAAAFVLVERRHLDPLVPAELMRMPSLRTASTLNLLLGLWNAGEMLVLSLYFQQVLADSPLLTGLAIAPQGVIGFTAGAFGARLSARIGIRRVLLLCSAAATAGFLVLTQLPAGGHYSPVMAAVMLVGFGTAGTAFGTTVTATGGVAEPDQGVVGGVINTSRQIGAALGAALLPAVAYAFGQGGQGGQTVDVSGARAAMLAGALVAALATVVAWRHRQAAGQRAQAGPSFTRAAVAPRSLAATLTANPHVQTAYRDTPPQQKAATARSSQPSGTHEGSEAPMALSTAAVVQLPRAWAAQRPRYTQLALAHMANPKGPSPTMHGHRQPWQ